MKTILLTGGTDGIGLETCKLFAEKGDYRLLVHGRNAEKLQNAKIEILKINPKANVDLIEADFSVLEDVKKMSNYVKENFKEIDVLINNAGIFFLEDGVEAITEDNIDVRFSVNTIAPYILTNNLLPILTDEARIINISSAAQAPVSVGDFKSTVSLSPTEAYSKSKLALIMWTMEMSEDTRHNKIFLSVNPGSFLGSKMVKLAYGKVGHDLKIGADILYRTAVTDEFANANGEYYDNDIRAFAKPHPFALEHSIRAQFIEFLDQFMD